MDPKPPSWGSARTLSPETSTNNGESFDIKCFPYIRLIQFDDLKKKNERDASGPTNLNVPRRPTTMETLILNTAYHEMRAHTSTHIPLPPHPHKTRFFLTTLQVPQPSPTATDEHHEQNWSRAHTFVCTFVHFHHANCQSACAMGTLRTTRNLCDHWRPTPPPPTPSLI